MIGMFVSVTLCSFFHLVNVPRWDHNNDDYDNWAGLQINICLTTPIWHDANLLCCWSGIVCGRACLSNRLIDIFLHLQCLKRWTRFGAAGECVWILEIVCGVRYVRDGPCPSTLYLVGWTSLLSKLIWPHLHIDVNNTHETKINYCLSKIVKFSLLLILSSFV